MIDFLEREVKTGDMICYINKYYKTLAYGIIENITSCTVKVRECTLEGVPKAGNYYTKKCTKNQIIKVWLKQKS